MFVSDNFATAALLTGSVLGLALVPLGQSDDGGNDSGDDGSDSPIAVVHGQAEMVKPSKGHSVADSGAAAPERIFLRPRHGLSEPLDEECMALVRQFAPQLKARFDASGGIIQLHYGSDCSGAEAPMTSWQRLAHALMKANIGRLQLVHEFASEHPTSYACHKYLGQNNTPRRLYADMHKRTAAGGPVVFCDQDLTPDDKGNVALPEWLDAYMTGFECQDLSFANRHGTPLVLMMQEGETIDGLGKSSATLHDSLKLVETLMPRSVTLENVGGCPAQDLLNYLKERLPMYVWGCFRADSADFAGNLVNSTCTCVSLR